jgi:hypothetical protein
MSDGITRGMREMIEEDEGLATTAKPGTMASVVQRQTVASVEVTNPKHYNQGNFIEPIDPIRGVGFNLGSAYKYIARLGLKGGDNTEQRDAKAAIWYSLDLMAYLMDDEDNVPSFQALSEVNLADYYKQLFDFAKTRECDLGDLEYCADYQKRTVLAAIDRIIGIERDSVPTGMDERQYQAHVLEAMLVGAQVVNYCWTAVFDGKPGDIFQIYKGSKSFKPTEATMDNVHAFMTLLTRLGLQKEGDRQAWDEPL